MPAFNVYCSVEPLDNKVLVLSQANGQCEWYPKEQTLPERPSICLCRYGLHRQNVVMKPFRGTGDHCVKVFLYQKLV